MAQDGVEMAEVPNHRMSEIDQQFEILGRFHGIQIDKVNPHLEHALSQLEFNDDFEEEDGDRVSIVDRGSTPAEGRPLVGDSKRQDQKPSFTAKEAKLDVAATVASNVKPSKVSAQGASDEIKLQLYVSYE